MEYSKIKCPKCGKTITIDPYEFCCPLCGEFIKEVDNTAVLNNHESREYIVEEKSVSGLQKIATSLFVVLSLLFTALNIGCVLVFINPKLIFKHVHFGWVIGIILFVSAVSVITSLVLNSQNKKLSCNYEDNAQVVKQINSKSSMLIVFSIIAVLLMIISLTTTKNKTIEISSKDDFLIISNLPNATNCKYKLTNDIDFENTSPEFWNKLNLGEDGVFDGNGYSIKNVYIENGTSYRYSGTSTHYYGLFEDSWGVIKNLKIENCIITAKSSGYFYMGTLCGENNGLITDCEIVDVYLIQNGNKNTGCYLGGIAGTNNRGTIENCKFINHNYKTEYPSALQSNSSGWVGYTYIAGIAHGGEINNCSTDYE